MQLFMIKNCKRQSALPQDVITFIKKSH